MSARFRDLPMRSQLVGPTLAFVRSAGGRADMLIDRFQLPKTAETDPEVTLPLSVLYRFFDDAAESIDDPFLGIHVATNYRRGTYGILEYACRSAPNLREALNRVVRYITLLNELIVVSMVEHPDETTVEQKIPGKPLAVGRHANEFFIALVVSVSRQLTGESLTPTRVWFAHPAPTNISELTQLLGTTRIEFGAEANGFAIETKLLDVTVLTSDPPLLSLLDRQAEQSLASRASPNRFLAGVREQIRAALRNGAPSLEAVATAMHLSARTLQRRLSDDGENFQDLVDSVRSDLAQLYLKDPKLPLGEVAFLLGYAELSAFLRAFKRWTGMTPGKFRTA